MLRSLRSLLGVIMGRGKSEKLKVKSCGVAFGDDVFVFEWFWREKMVLRVSLDSGSSPEWHWLVLASFWVCCEKWWA